VDKTWQYWCEQKWQKMDAIKITIIVFYATMYVIYPIKFQISIQNKFETLICNTNEPILHTLMMTINPLKRMFSYLNLSFYYLCLIFSFDGCRITFLFHYNRKFLNKNWLKIEKIKTAILISIDILIVLS
jgi:hypothetical protein